MFSKPSTWRALVAFGAVAISFVLALTIPANLGLDLSGGTQIVLETQDSDRVQADADATDRALEILRGRVDSLGVSEPTLARSGENRIIIELPDVQDPAEALEVIGQTAQLTFHEVLAPAGQTEPAEDELVLPDESGQPLLLGPVALDGEGIEGASAGQPEGGFGQWVVNVDFSSTGRGPWRELVGAACTNPAAGQRIAIVLDETIISAPAIQPSLCQMGGGSSTSITGTFTQAEANDLAVLIEGGALPVPVEIIEQRTVGPTLGAAAIDASINAAIIGLIATGLFIIAVYRLVGFTATIALSTYALLAYGMLVWLGATLTLPGLAGFVLAIGLAIDANVLVYERAREEYQKSVTEGETPSLEKSLTTGFQKAWSAIIDSNVTTILAAVLLFFLASGPVRGFGVTLTIGVVASMVSALVIARVLAEFAIRRKFAQKRPGITGIAGTGKIRHWLNTSGPDLMKRSGVWVLVTIAVAVIAIGGIVVRGLNLGVEFTGGRLLEYSTAQAVDVEDVRVAVGEAGFANAVVQESSSDGSGENISVRIDDITEEEAQEVADAVATVAGETSLVRDEFIGPSLGQELRDRAIIAFIIAIGAQMIYLAWRFRWTWALAAITSMSSVVLLVVGIWAWWGKSVDGVFLAAVLSIIGLATNDTIVVFDRIRENIQSIDRKHLRRAVNDAIMQTIPRTINTGLGAVFILAALAVLGGDSLQDFALALLLGLNVGMFSTVFTGSAIAILLEEKWPYDPSKAPRENADKYAHLENQRDDGAVL